MIIEAAPNGSYQHPAQVMTNLDQITVSPRERQVLGLLGQGYSNKEIGVQLNIGLHTVKQHLRLLFSRAGIREGDKRVKLARYVRENEGAVITLCEGLTPREIQISILVWEGLTNREIGKMVGTSAQGVKNHLRSAFDKLGVWTRLELAMYVADHGGMLGDPGCALNPFGVCEPVRWGVLAVCCAAHVGRESAYLDRAG